MGMSAAKVFDRSNLTRAVRAEEKLLHTAYLDPVTSLYSRRLISTIVEEQVTRSQQTGRPFVVVDLDLDHFRRINTAFGAAFGDAVLRGVAERLSGLVGDADSLARVAPDEFLLVLPGRKRGAALDRWLATLLRTLTEQSLIIDDQEIFVSARIGVAAFPDDGGNGADLIARAGRNLMRSKSDGPTTDGPELFLLETALHRALDRDEFRLCYQPQIDLGSGRVVAAESLLRWPRPDLSMISPAIFIPLAETTGLIGPVSVWVVNRLLADLRDWARMDLREVPVGLNLSARLFSDSWLDRALLPILEGSGISPHRVKLELTETALLEDADRTYRIMEKMRDRGFTLAVQVFFCKFAQKTT